MLRKPTDFGLQVCGWCALYPLQLSEGVAAHQVDCANFRQRKVLLLEGLPVRDLSARLLGELLYKWEEVLTRGHPNAGD